MLIGFAFNFCSSYDRLNITKISARMCLWAHPIPSDRYSHYAGKNAPIIISGLVRKYNGQLISAYAKLGHMEVAHKLFDKLPQRTVEAWSAIIIAYSRLGRPGEVIGLHNQMISEGIRPDSSSFTVAMKACTTLSDLRKAREIWGRAADLGYDRDVFVGSSMLNLYAKCGKMDEARRIFHGMRRRDLVCWTTMITGFAQGGQAKEAIEVYRMMQKEGVEGDGVVMLGLLQASACLGDKKIGPSVHGHLLRRNLRMDSVVQTSLVDMYAKIGHLNLASLYG